MNALIKRSVKTIFLIKFLFTVSSPFAIIIAEGNRKNNNSVPFLLGTKNANNSVITRFIIKRIQLFLNELFTDKVFGDFKNIEITENITINIDIQ
ncbi:tRNA (guanine-N7)-methyltransferase [Polaribacter sp. IC073]|nr:tRNA (guanine-N7)-methyltransferase [Polaribacter sp. IC073]